MLGKEGSWRVLEGDELREFLSSLTEPQKQTEIERLHAALLCVARFSHAKDFSHHGVSFEECDKQSCAEARDELRTRYAKEIKEVA